MIIDTLLTVFEADYKPYVKGAKEVDKTTTDVSKKMTDAEKSAKGLEHGMANLAKKAAELTVGFFALKHISDEVFNAGKNAIELKKLSDVTNMSMADIAAWGHAVVETGGDANSFRSSIGNLNKGVQELALTGESSLLPAMQYLGLQFLDTHRKAKPMNEILLDLAGKMQGLDKQKALSIGERLGLDQGTIFLLMRGRAATEEMLKKKKELGALDAANAETAMKFNVAMDETHARLEHIYMAIGSVVLPALNWLLKAFGSVYDFMADHKPFMIAFLALLTVAFWDLAAATWAWVAPLIAAAAPIILLVVIIAALAAGIALLIDDVWNFLEGNESVIGDVIALWGDFENFMSDLFKNIGEAVQDFVDTYLPFINDILAGLDKIQALGAKAASFIFGAAQNPVNSQTSTSIVGDNMRQNNYNIKASATVNTQATDATGVQKAVGNSLGEQLRSAVSQHDDGVQA